MPRVPHDDPSRVDVLVVGAGPAGAAAAFWLAERGHSRARRRQEGVPAREDLRRRPDARGRPPARRHGPGRARCADFHRYDGLRSIAHGITLELAWPEHPDFPSYGYVVRRRDLDEMVADQAVKAGRHPLARRRGRRARSSRTGWSPGAVIARKDTGTTEVVRARVRGGRRRRELALRAGARHRPGPLVPDGHGDSRLFHQSVPRRAVDRVPPRPARPGRQPHARLRLDLPGRRRHRERRRRPPRHLHRLHERQHLQIDGGVRRDRAGPLGHLARDVLRAADRRQAAHGRVGAPRRSGPPGSSPATPPARSTRSTARASPTGTKPDDSPRMR